MSGYCLAYALTPSHAYQWLLVIRLTETACKFEMAIDYATIPAIQKYNPTVSALGYFGRWLGNANVVNLRCL